MTYGVMPALDPTMYARVQLEPWTWMTAHLVFGAGLGVLPAAQHAVRVRRHPPPPKPHLVLVSSRRR